LATDPATGLANELSLQHFPELSEFQNKGNVENCFAGVNFCNIFTGLKLQYGQVVFTKLLSNLPVGLSAQTLITYSEEQYLPAC